MRSVPHLIRLLKPCFTLCLPGPSFRPRFRRKTNIGGYVFSREKQFLVMVKGKVENSSFFNTAGISGCAQEPTMQKRLCSRVIQVLLPPFCFTCKTGSPPTKTCISALLHKDQVRGGFYLPTGKRHWLMCSNERHFIQNLKHSMLLSGDLL